MRSASGMELGPLYKLRPEVGIVHTDSYNLTVTVISKQGQMPRQDLLNHAVSVRDGVGALVQPQVLGDGLVGVGGGVQQVVHNIRSFRPNYGVCQEHVSISVQFRWRQLLSCRFSLCRSILLPLLLSHMFQCLLSLTNRRLSRQQPGQS